MKLCEYGCGQEAKYQFKNGKWCCSNNISKCQFIRKKKSESQKGIKKNSLSKEHKKKISKAHKGISKGPFSEEHKKNLSRSMKGKIPYNRGKPRSTKTRRKISKSHKFALKDYKEKHPLFSKVEELREIKNGEIQGHCKNHNCENSKEKGGWFTLNKAQLFYRIGCLENPKGFGESNFYCCQECKDTCILYRRRSDPYKNIKLPYTQIEYQTFRTFVLERDNHICQFCGEPATHVHHERPQKLEPFYALDPDYAWSCCKKCHYKKGHQGECSTGNLAKIVCSVESQKFLSQAQ